MIQTGLTDVSIKTVADLYEERKRMDVPDYYEDGQRNPYDGLCAIIPTKATYYAVVPEANEADVALARALLKGVGKRRKVRETVCLKHEINYNRFSKSGNIVVLFV